MGENDAANQLKKKSTWLNKLVYLGGFLIICNVLSVIFLPVITTRYLRLISSVIILLYYLFLLPKHNLLFFFAIAAFIVRDYFSIYYESQTSTYLYFVFGFIAYSILVIKQARNLRLYRVQLPSLLSLVLFAIASFFILILLETLVKENFTSSATTYFFYSMGTSIILLLFIAIYYHYRLGNLRSLIFSFSVFSFMISDAICCFAYYMDLYNLYIAVRLFYILGLILLTNYAVNSTLRKKELSFKEELW
ncbi:hypothetical protein [Leeuwenhoekiella sp. NPDC079379]|uniref:hypothetical protein n=1 Tax=Leeuwenhoekiella sp. NPDC079379 TaxID=3364122 RepID=UPI0037CBEEC3